ncbi:hypothetical protein EU528_09490 [Candidatus Thorarchaeota archaeon]|nr:MAG: hypothetical protein EU528_09490 [Candidatus Thorarchaeota archaeon]
MSSESGKVKVHCDICNRPVEFQVSQEKIREQKDGILRVALAHGDPIHAIIVYIDKNLRVRGVEVSDSFQMEGTRAETVVAASEVAENLSEAMGEPCFQALYSFAEVEEREKTAFILDKTILRTICESGVICLGKIRQKIAFLEKAMGDRIDLPQIQSVCERYVQEGLIKRI